MVPRSKTVDGKRVVWTLKLSEPEAESAEEVIAASGWTRSEWLRHLVLVATAGHRDSRTARAEMQAAVKRSAPVAESSRKPPRAAPSENGPCKHAHAIKGWCRECRTGGH